MQGSYTCINLKLFESFHSAFMYFLGFEMKNLLDLCLKYKIVVL